MATKKTTKPKVNSTAANPSAQVKALNAAREAAVSSGKSAYGGNLASLSSFTSSSAPKVSAPTSSSGGGGGMSSIAKPGALQALSSAPAFQVSAPTAGIVPQVYSGSSTTAMGGIKDYSSPSSTFLAGAPAPTKPLASQVQAGSNAAPSTNSGGGGMLSNAYNALKTALTSAGSKLFGSGPAQSSATALEGANQAVPAVQPPPTPAATPSVSTPGVDLSSINRTAGPGQVGKISDQYAVITQDRNSDSATLKKNIDLVKAQEDAEKQAQIQNIQAQLAQKRAQLAAMQAAEQAVSNPLQPDQQQPYQPEKQADISNLTAQIKAMEAEIERVMRDSPELLAATEALNAKIADEAAINARLTQGRAGIGEQPIAYSFISGQQEALENRANADLQTNAAQRVPLQQQLATEQAKKQSALDVVKSKYGFLSNERERATDAYKTNYNRANTVSDRATEQVNKGVDRAADQVNRLALEKAQFQSDLKLATIKEATAAKKAVKYDGNTILSGINNDLIADVRNGGSLANLYNAYPEVQRLYIEEVFRRLSPLRNKGVTA
jgi:hypothetical protein